MRDVRTAVLNGALIIAAFGLAFSPLIGNGVLGFMALGIAFSILFVAARLLLSAVRGAGVRWRLRTGRVLTCAALVGVLVSLGYSRGWPVVWNSLLGIGGIALVGRAHRTEAARTGGPVRAPVSRRQTTHPD